MVAGHALFERKPRAPGSPPSKRPLFSKESLRGGARFLERLVRKAQGPCVGIDLGTGAVKLVRMDRLNGEWSVSGVACEEYPRDISEQEKTGFLAAKLREFRQRGLLGGRVAFGISDDRVTVESLSLPKMPAGDLAKAVAWEAKERFGADAATHCVRHLLVEERQVDGQLQMETLVFIVPRQEVVPAAETISDQGCRVAAAEPGILAVAAALEASGFGKADGFWAVLDVGFRHSTLVCLVGGRVRFVRSFSVAGEAMTRSIAEYCKTDVESAERQKQTVGLDVQLQVGHAMVMHLDRLITEVDQSLRYVTYYAIERGRAAPIDRLYLTGGGTLLKGLPKFMESRLSVKVEAVNSFEKTAISEEVRRRLGAEAPPARLMGALGLAIRLTGKE